LTCSEARAVHLDFEHAWSGPEPRGAIVDGSTHANGIEGKRIVEAEGRVLSYRHLSYEAIADLVDDRLRGDELPVAISHLRGCRQCAAEWSGLQRFASQVTGTGSAVLVDRQQNEVSAMRAEVAAVVPSRKSHGEGFYCFDSNYVQRLRDGDLEAESHFVGYFRQLLRIKLRARYLSADVIDDIVQETFVRVFRSVRVGGLRQPERIGAYVNSVCNFALQEYFRAKGKHRAMEDENMIPDAVLCLEQLAIKAELTDRVREAIESLAPRERDMIRKIFFQEMEKDEVCAELGVSRDYLRVLLHRAIEHLREVMEIRDLLPKPSEPEKSTNRPREGTRFDSKDVN